jgi:hypothetical protein
MTGRVAGDAAAETLRAQCKTLADAPPASDLASRCDACATVRAAKTGRPKRVRRTLCVFRPRRLPAGACHGNVTASVTTYDHR